MLWVYVLLLNLEVLGGMRKPASGVIVRFNSIILKLE